MSELALGRHVLDSAIVGFRDDKSLADRAVAQVSDRDLHRPLPGDRNSIAIIMKHMAGNMISRWTEFLTTDGEKPWRDRDREFVDDFHSRDEVLACWERGWSRVFSTIESLTPEDVGRMVTVRGEPHTVVAAIHRQLAHYGYHVGQIVLIARIHVGEAAWVPLTIPPGASDAFNRAKGYAP